MNSDAPGNPRTRPIVLHPGDSLTTRQRLVYIVVLGALTALGPFTIDLYLPAFPLIEQDFATTAAAIQLTLTATTVGFGLGQLAVGPWSDKIGRRLPLIVATALHVGASLGVALAPDLVSLGFFRVLQGMGAAGGGVVATAIVRDLFGGLPLVRMLSRLALVNGLAPILAPVIGSQLLRIVDWRGIFFALAGYGVLALAAAIFFIVETYPKARRVDAGHSTAKERYRNLFTDRIFVGVALVGAMNFTGLFAYLSSSSFILQGVWGLDPQQYGLVFAINSLGVVSGVQISSRLARYIGPQWVLLIAVSASFLAATAIVVCDVLDTDILGLLIPLWFLIFSVGFVFPCVQVLALANHGSEAGTAASLTGAINFLLAGALSPVVGLFGITSAIPMGVMIMITTTMSILLLVFVVRPKTVPALSR